MTLRRVCGFASSLALHAIGVLVLVWTPMLPRRPLIQASPQRASIEVFAAPPAEPPGLPGLQVANTEPEAPAPTLGAGQTELSIRGLSLDLHKIAGRATLLFPFVTPGLALVQFGLVPRAAERRGGLPSPFPVSPLYDLAEVRNRPLVLDVAARQYMIDKAWSRRERWQAFQMIEALADTYSADEGDLPRVLQMYFQQNGLQPYADPGARDHRLWAQLDVAADHVDFVGFISRYTRGHPGSKASTELLLVLDMVAQASFNHLITLLSIRPDIDLMLTRRSNRAAYDFILEIQRYYTTELEKKRLESPEAIRTFYDAIRLALLESIIRVTPQGYRASDARFLMGDIYWRQGNVSAAREAWRGMTIDESDTYVTTYSEILRVLEDSASSPAAQAAAIDRALEQGLSRWRSASYDRLKQFGYRFDTF